jgi:hypothetical protein
MLIEIWERVRGYNEWTPTIATVQSSTVGSQSVCKIVWEDQHCIQHTATFKAFEESPLYQLREGDTVSIRFNPDRPGEFYLPGLFQSKLARTFRLGVCAIVFILVFIALFGPDILSTFSH